MKKTFLFACGCPRSGTTALWNLLSGDERIRIGVERYGNKFFTREFITADLFEKERFFSPQQGDTFYLDLDKFSTYYCRAKEGYENAVYYGDKIPKLYGYLDRVKENFPDRKVIFIYRNIFDVAASYKARQQNPQDNWSMGVTEAIADWNSSLHAAQKHRDDLLIVDYERLFVEGEGLASIYDYLQLDITQEVKVLYRNLLIRSQQLEGQRPRSLNALETKEICECADFEAYRFLVNLTRPKDTADKGGNQTDNAAG